jgi:hypothetical protein
VGTIKIKTNLAPAPLEFDFLVIAAPLPAIVSVLDADPRETQFAQGLKPFLICTHLIHCQNPYDSRDQSMVSFPQGLGVSGQGHVYSIRNSRKAVNDESGPGPNGKFSFVTYQLLSEPSQTPDELKTTMIADVERYGLTDIDVEAQAIHRYFYHFDGDDLQAGLPWMIHQMQGSHRTLYTGCSVSFESVNDVVSFNKMLMERFVTISQLI